MEEGAKGSQTTFVIQKMFYHFTGFVWDSVTSLALSSTKHLSLFFVLLLYNVLLIDSSLFLNNIFLRTHLQEAFLIMLCPLSDSNSIKRLQVTLQGIQLLKVYFYNAWLRKFLQYVGKNFNFLRIQHLAIWLHEASDKILA